MMFSVPGHRWPRTCGRGDSGFILIAVLWVAMLLSIFALNYATTSRLGAHRALTGERLVTENHALLSAVAVAEHKLRVYLANQERLDQLSETDPDGEESEAREHLFYPRFEAYELDVGDFRVLVRMTADAGKWNVNTADEALLETILIACGVEFGSATTMVTNSILDWIDEDDLRRLEGAETPYYMGLEHPYPAKNGPLQSIEELLLIRGIDTALFWGTDEHPGLADFLTVSGDAQKLDINSASPRVMALVPGIRQETIDTIIDQRSTDRIRRMSDLAPHLDALDYDQVVEYFDVSGFDNVTIEARVVDPGTNRPGRPLRIDIDL